MSGFNVGEVFSQSLRFLFKQWRAVATFAVAPYGLLLLTNVLIDMATADQVAAFYEDLIKFQTELAEPTAEHAPSIEQDGFVFTDSTTGNSVDVGPFLGTYLLISLAALIVPVPFKVVWLRYCLLGPSHEPVRPVIRFAGREVRFLGRTIGLYLILMLVLVGFSVIGGLSGGPQTASLLGLVGTGIAIWIAARLYFVFPAQVIDLKGGFGRAWNESRGQAFKLILLTLMLALTFVPPLILVGLVLASVPLVAQIATLIVMMVLDAALWTALAFAYWKTTGNPGPQTKVDVTAIE